MLFCVSRQSVYKYRTCVQFARPVSSDVWRVVRTLRPALRVRLEYRGDADDEQLTLPDAAAPVDQVTILSAASCVKLIGEGSRELQISGRKDTVLKILIYPQNLHFWKIIFRLKKFADRLN